MANVSEAEQCSLPGTYRVQASWALQAASNSIWKSFAEIITMQRRKLENWKFQGAWCESNRTGHQKEREFDRPFDIPWEDTCQPVRLRCETSGWQGRPHTRTERNFGPTFIYLTHTRAVKQSSRHGPRLCTWIDDHARFPEVIRQACP